MVSTGNSVTRMAKVVVIGLDAASPHLIRQWQDYLPNLTAIMKNGVSGILESSDPPDTCPAWHCFATGKEPGEIWDLRFR